MKSAELPRRLRLMVITDRRLAGRRGWLAVAETALAAGATAIQLRDKQVASGTLLALARDLKPLCERFDALFLVNDRYDVALAAGADGVHLGEDDVPVAAVRRLAPRDFLIGRSADTEAAALQAEADGADYLGVGSLFGTRSKQEVLGEVIGVDRLRRVARAVSIPVLGIGGVSAANAGAVAAAGAAGIAVISAVMGAADPGAATCQLRESWERGLRR